MSESKKQAGGIGFFEKYLSIWVTLCIISGIAIGYFIPAFPANLGKWEYANVSIPIAILIWLMIYPMMLKVDFKSVMNVGKRPKGIFITCVTNWLIKPFTMFGIAWLFLLRNFQNTNPDRACRPISGRGRSSWSGTLYGNGIRMELPHKR